ncbi:MAG: NAD-dependent epimerase/dehydratase family protein [Candidatus Thorarchaeota archaeon]
MTMVHCFVTGGNGFVGSHIVRELEKRGHDITLLLRKSSNLDLISGVSFKTVTGDVTDFSSLISGIPNDTEWLFHNAAIMADWGGKQHFIPVNVEGTRNILEVVRKKDIPCLIHTSSTAVYGFPNKVEPMVEDDEWKPMNTYQKSKAEAEKLILEYTETYGVKVTRVRPPTVVGKGDLFTGPQIIERIKNESMVTFGGGNNLQSFAHGEDVGSCIVLAAEHFEKSAGNAYNVCSFTSTMREFIEGIADEVNAKKKFQNFPYTMALGLGRMAGGLYRAFNRKKAPPITAFVVKLFGSNYVVSAQKAIHELGFRPKWDLESTVKDMVAWGGYVKPR